MTTSQVTSRLDETIFDSEVLMQGWAEAAVEDLIAWIASQPDKEILIGRALAVIDRQIQIDRENQGELDIVNPALEALTALRARIAALDVPDDAAKAQAAREATALFFGTFFRESDTRPDDLDPDGMVAFIQKLFESGHYPTMRDQVLADSQAMIDALNRAAESVEENWILDDLRANNALRQRLIFAFEKINLALDHQIRKTERPVKQTVLGPSAMKKRIEAILKSHGLLEAFQKMDDFFVRLVDRRGSFMPLTIEKHVLPDHSWQVILCHLVYLDGHFSGDIIKDPEVVFIVPQEENPGWWPVEITQNVPLENKTRCKFFERDGKTHVDCRFHEQVQPMVTNWAKQLKFLGYHDTDKFVPHDKDGQEVIAVIDDSDDIPDEEETTHE